jgi:hypothetical protein
MFIIKNLDKIKIAIDIVEKDLVTKNKQSDEMILKKERIQYYLQFKERIKNTPLATLLYSNTNAGNNIGSPLVLQQCYVCKKHKEDHSGYGMISTCCGAFYCQNCVKAMSTHFIRSDKEILEDPDNTYCCCCRDKNPKFYTNMNKKKDSNVYSYSLIQDNFIMDELKDSTAFDYYFYMLLKGGFIPLCSEGKPLNVQTDINQGIINLSEKSFPILKKITAKDQLAIISIKVIADILKHFNIKPRRGATMLLYNCPKYMQKRVKGYYDENKLMGVDLSFHDNVGQLIGIHQNIIAIIVWRNPSTQDEINQIIGRMIRLNNFNNELTFYITISSIGFD